MQDRDPRSWMWAEALDLIEQAQRLQRHFSRVVGRGGTRACWEPPVDVIEWPSELMVRVALPGIAPGAIDLHLDGDALVVRAERASSASGHAGAIRRLEIPYGTFERRIALPEGEYELIEHSAVNGCLTLKLRKHQGPA